MNKVVCLEKSVFELVQEHQELINLMKELGFSEISNPIMLNSIGKVMTIPQGAKIKNIAMEEIIDKLESNGFVVEWNNPVVKENKALKKTNDKKDSRLELLKNYLSRLSRGENLEAVKKEFVQAFKEVDATEIMKAEQEILAEGTPLKDVQRLCDLHSALFHGVTTKEKTVEIKKGVDGSKIREERAEKTRALVAEKGHPLWLFTKENEVLEKRLAKAKRQLEEKNLSKQTLEMLRDISIHYAKKGDLLYPILKVDYNISGPSDVMWTVDDDIRDEISRLWKAPIVDTAWEKQVEDLLLRIEEMIYKENNILFPNCAYNFTEKEWIGIYHDQKDYAQCFGVRQERWEKAEKNTVDVQESFSDKEVVMAGGHMTVEQLTAMLNTLPLEITFVDADNINRFFNEGPKDFKRPKMAIDRDVFSCHPPKIEAKVRQIIEEFRAGRLDELPIWMEKNGKCVLVKYMAVRDKNKNYIGTMEIVQNMDFAKEHFLPQRHQVEEY